MNYVAYDARFRDTNVTRLLERLGARGGDDDAAAEPPPEPAPRASKFRARVINGVIEVKAAGPLGTRPVCPAISIDDEAISSEVLASRVKFAAAKGRDTDLALQREARDGRTNKKKYPDFEISCKRGSDVSNSAESPRSRPR